MSSNNNNKLSISLSLTNPPRRIVIEIPSPSPSSALHKVASDATTIPLASLRIIFRGKIIPSHEEGNVVEDFKIEDGCVLHCMGKPAAITTSASNAAAAVSSAAIHSAGSVVTPPVSASTAVPTVVPTATAATTTTSNNAHPLKISLQAMKNNHTNAEYTTALNTISKLLSNIMNNPMEEKYRNVKRTNAAFTKRLGRLHHSHEAMTSIGFVTTSTTDNNQDGYALVPNADAWPKLTACKQIIDNELILNQQRNAASTSTPTTATNPTIPDLGFGGIPNMGMGMPPPGTSQMMESVLSNPQALSSMMSDPTIQNMILNDPRMANNPMMQNSMRSMLNNPNMVQQMSQMMNNPNVRSRLDSMLQQQNAGGNGNGDGNSNSNSAGGMDMAAQMEMMRQFSNIASTSNTNTNGIQQPQQQQQQQQPSNSNNNTNNNNNNNNGGERQMTEEEMIAEAIARSMREQ